MGFPVIKFTLTDDERDRAMLLIRKKSKNKEPSAKERKVFAKDLAEYIINRLDINTQKDDLSNNYIHSATILVISADVKRITDSGGR